MKRLLGVVLLACATLSAGAAQSLKVIVFPGGFNWPLWVAREKGFFVAQDLDVEVTPTPNSVFQMQNLAAGKFDIAFSTVDNVVAYQEGQGEAPLAAAPDFFVFMGGQYGAVRLVARPEIRSIADLKGRKLAVDAATTGYAFVMRKLLQQGGLAESDYELEKLGGTAARAEALLQGKTDATILTSPLEIVPEARGFRRLANAVDAIGPYQAVSGVARRGWARDNADALVGFIRAYVEASEWLRKPANRAEAVAIYRRNLPQASEESAQAAWDVLLTGPEGLQRRAALSREGVDTVLRLRSEFGRPRKLLTDVDRYIDETYYRKAVQ
ncbi:MAG TPA: ABC transporter substrate-binding protein [Usitatibacter sp.]|nr:ABC transporter substrate-binding protein [Usitatibacter sp.]